MADQLFKVHKLNAEGMRKASNIANAFHDIIDELQLQGCKDGREFAIVKTKLEEACFFAKKSMAMQPENQES
jgi:hypothetical protein